MTIRTVARNAAAALMDSIRMTQYGRIEMTTAIAALLATTVVIPRHSITARAKQAGSRFPGTAASYPSTARLSETLL